MCQTFRNAFQAVISEVDRRCIELTHPVPETAKEAAEKLKVMKKIIDLALYGLEHDDDTLGAASLYIAIERKTERENETKNDQAGGAR